MSTAIRLAPIKSPLECNLDYIEEPLLLVENTIRASINNLNESFQRFWSLSDPQLEEVMNYFGLERTIEVLTGHYVTATALNTIRNLRGMGGPLAICEKPRDFDVDPDTGLIRIVPIGGWPVITPPFVDPRTIVDNPEYDPRFDPTSEVYDEEYVLNNPYTPPSPNLP